MNNTFNDLRFGKLFRKHTIENYRKYLMSLGVLGGSLVLFYSFMITIGGNKSIALETQMIAFFFFYIGGGVIFTSSIFSDPGNPRESIAALILPASHFEKFLVAWLYSFLIYSGIFLLLFYAIDFSFVHASTQKNKALLDIFDKEKEYYIIFPIYAVLHAFALYGAVFFKKMHFIKTACLFFLLLVITTVFHKQLVQLLIPKSLYVGQPLGGLQLLDGDNYFLISLEQETKKFYAIVLFAGCTLTLWAGAYFQLKEKQI